VQGLLIGEVGLSVLRGLAPGIGLGLTVPVRAVRDRIRFEDLARQPYVQPNPDTHHRNETLTGIADPQLNALLTRLTGPWTLSASLGTSIPLGKTEPNPFELGREGLPHQHIQFGTGTWNPVASLFAGRGIGGFGFSATAFTKVSLYENPHGYRAGNRYSLLVNGSRRLRGGWSANAGLNAAREEAETWSGIVETEGNLGRTDLFAQLGAVRGSAGGGTFSWTLQIPIRTWATGEQVSFPAVISMSWSR
jgi:hypothetical protein